MMREMGIRCGIRRETDRHRYGSYKGVVGEIFENVVGCDFAADGSWWKMDTDVTEFKQPWGKTYFAPVYDFCSKGIVARSTSASPNMAQRTALLDRLLAKMPEGGQTDTPQRHGLAVPACGVDGEARAGRHGAEHVAEGQLHRQRRDRAGLRASEGRVLQRQEMDQLRVVQGGLGCVRHPLEHEAQAG